MKVKVMHKVHWAGNTPRLVKTAPVEHTIEAVYADGSVRTETGDTFFVEETGDKRCPYRTIAKL